MAPSCPTLRLLHLEHRGGGTESTEYCCPSKPVKRGAKRAEGLPRKEQRGSVGAGCAGSTSQEERDEGWAVAVELGDTC